MTLKWMNERKIFKKTKCLINLKVISSLKNAHSL
jgi:hypothetical protein